MNGKAIRQAAREQIKGRRGFLLLAVALSNLPNALCSQILPRIGLEPPEFLNWLVSLFCGLLALGVIKIALEQVESKPKSYWSLFFSFRPGVFLNALILTVALGLFSSLISTMTAVMGTVGLILNLIVLLLLELLFFFIRYCFVLDPAHSLLNCVQKGLGMGIHWCGDVFVFNLCLVGPIFLAYVGYVLLFALLRGSLILLLILLLFALVGIAALFWYLPYVTLAQAMFARERILDEERTDPPPPPQKHMRLVKKDGWCRVNTATGKGAKNLQTKKDGEAIER